MLKTVLHLDYEERGNSMSYFMLKLDEDFRIKESDFPAACNALKAFVESQKELEYIDSAEVIKHCNKGDLIRALDACKWECNEGEDGIDNIIPGKTQLGSDYEILNAIAPFVVEKSFITMLGEEKEIWRWIFKNGICIQENAEIVFESDPIYAVTCSWIANGESGVSLLGVTTDLSKAQKVMKDQIEEEKNNSWIAHVCPESVGNDENASFCEELSETEWSFYKRGHYCAKHTDITIHKYERKEENA